MHATAMMYLAATKSGSSSILGFLPIVLIAIVAYMFLVRPARRRQANAVKARSNVTVGDEVVTTAGLFATVTAVDDEAVTLEVAPGVRSRFLPQSVVRVVTPADRPADENEGEEPATAPDADEPGDTDHTNRSAPA